MEAGPIPGACLHGPLTAKNPNKVQYQYNPESVVKLPSEKVGYPDKDTRYAFVHPSGILPNSTILIIQFACRPVSKASRAGTRGFHAPELLLKCGEQTGGMRPPFV